MSTLLFWPSNLFFEVYMSGGAPLSDPIEFVSKSNTTYASRTNTTITAPLSIQDGDLLLAVMVTAAVGGAPTVTPPTGFELVNSVESTDFVNFNLNMEVYSKFASGETGDYTFSHSAGSSQGVMLVYRNVHSTILDVASTTNTGEGAISTWTGVTVNTNGTTLVGVGYDWANTANDLTPPLGTTERHDVALTYVFDKTIEMADDTGNFTAANNADAQHWGTILLPLRPASAQPYVNRTYFVRSGGSDTNPGSTELPFATIDYGLSRLYPGDTLSIGDGTWGAFTLSLSGTSTRPITIESENLHGAHIDEDGYAAILVTGNYLVIDGLEISNYSRHGIECQNNHHITVRNCHVHDCGGNGIGALRGDHYTFEGNLVEDCGRTGWNSGISVYQPDGTLTGNTSTAPERNIFRNNRIYNCWQLAFVSFDTGTTEIVVGDEVVIGGVITGIVDRVELTSGTWGVDAAGRIGIKTSTRSGWPTIGSNIQVSAATVAVTTSIIFTDNGVFTDGNGIILDDWGWYQDENPYFYPYGALVENNLVVGSGGKGIQCYAVSGDCVVRNNTLYHNNRDGMQIYLGPDDGMTWRGDLSAQDSPAKFINNVVVTDDSLDPNVSPIGIYGGDMVALIGWNITDDGDTGEVFTQSASYTNLGGNQFGVDPELASPGYLTTDDFRLLSTSPAIDVGTSSYGFNSTDIAGVERTSSTINLGCYETTV